MSIHTFEHIYIMHSTLVNLRTNISQTRIQLIPRKENDNKTIIRDRNLTSLILNRRKVTGDDNMEAGTRSYI